MSKEVAAGGIVSPGNLWGKPLPKTLHKEKEATKKEKDTGMLPEEEDITDDDVDAELEEDEPSEAELVAEEDTADPADPDEAGDEEPSYDDDEESDEGDSEDVDDDGVDSVVEPDEKVSKKKRVTTPMAGKKKSMSDHVREEIARRQDAGDSLRGVDIVTALAKKGVKVSAAQVSQLLKKAGVSAKARGPKRAKAAAEERSRVAVSTKKGEPSRIAPKIKPASTGVAGLPVARLKAAKDFIAACGDSYADAVSVLELHKQLHDVL